MSFEDVACGLLVERAAERQPFDEFWHNVSAQFAASATRRGAAAIGHESDDSLAQKFPRAPAKTAAAGGGFRVTFNSPQSGYMSVGLRGADGAEFVTAVACGPRDSLRELASALASLARGAAGAAAVRWNCEPEELAFRFERRGAGRLRFEVWRYAARERADEPGRRVFAAEEKAAEVCGAFLRAFERLRRDREVDAFESNWRREFPESEFAELTRAVNEGTDAER